MLAAHDGVVVMSGVWSEWGEYLRIRRSDGCESGYAHLQTRRVFVGDRVKAGDRLGLSGDSGRAFGFHLHFEWWINGSRADPEPFLFS